MNRSFYKSIILSCSLFLIVLLNSCGIYYVRNAQTSFTAPDPSPVNTPVRLMGDIRLGIGMVINPDPDLDFDNGLNPFNPYNADDINSSPYIKKYADSLGYPTNKNVHLSFPTFQGSLLFDYSIRDNMFLFCKIMAGYADDIPSGAMNIGIGSLFGKKKIRLNGYIAPLFYTLNNKSLIIPETNMQYYSTSTSLRSYSSDDRIAFGISGGLRALTNRGDNALNFGWGLDLQFQKYLEYYDTLSYSSTTKNYTAYRVLFFCPTLIVLKQFGGSQVDASINYTIPFFPVSTHDKLDITPRDALLSIRLNYSYCIGKNVTHSNK